MKTADTLRVVYVAGRYRSSTPWGVVQNVRRAEEWGLKVFQAGGSAIIPQVNTANFDKLLPDDFWLHATEAMLRKCDVMLVIPGWETSEGTKHEIRVAKQRGIPTFYADTQWEAFVDYINAEQQTASYHMS